MSDGSDRYDHLSDKAKGYAEGVCHGYDEAARRIEEITGGLLTLKDTKSIENWRETVRCLKRPKRQS